MITTPNNDIPMPADIQASYDAAKNAVTLAEAEVVRLRDLRVAEETTIIELNKQIAYAKEQTDSLQKTIDTSNAELTNLLDQVISARAEIETMRVQKDELTNSLTERENICATKESDVNSRELSVALREASLNEREVLLEDRESNVNTKSDKLKTFLADF